MRSSRQPGRASRRSFCRAWDERIVWDRIASALCEILSAARRENRLAHPGGAAAKPRSRRGGYPANARLSPSGATQWERGLRTWSNGGKEATKGKRSFFLESYVREPAHAPTRKSVARSRIIAAPLGLEILSTLTHPSGFAASRYASRVGYTLVAPNGAWNILRRKVISHENSSIRFHRFFYLGNTFY